MISENKLKHMLGVARECRNLARQRGLSKEVCDAMFIMGLLHDVGYEDEENSYHPSISDEMISNFIINADLCSGAIASHGLAFDNWGIFDEILNTADMTISHTGDKVTIDKRLKSIGERHGFDSIIYKHAFEVARKIKSNKGD